MRTAAKWFSAAFEASSFTEHACRIECASELSDHVGIFEKARFFLLAFFSVYALVLLRVVENVFSVDENMTGKSFQIHQH